MGRWQSPSHATVPYRPAADQLGEKRGSLDVPDWSDTSVREGDGGGGCVALTRREAFRPLVVVSCFLKLLPALPENHREHREGADRISP